MYKFWFVGRADLSELLTDMDDWIAEARDLALSRKDILEKVGKWTSATEEEGWLGEYEGENDFFLIFKCFIVKVLYCCICHRPFIWFQFQDQNRYNAGRGAHINLKRAEKARVLVSKIPCMPPYFCMCFYWKFLLFGWAFTWLSFWIAWTIAVSMLNFTRCLICSRWIL